MCTSLNTIISYHSPPPAHPYVETVGKDIDVGTGWRNTYSKSKALSLSGVHLHDPFRCATDNGGVYVDKIMNIFNIYKYI